MQSAARRPRRASQRFCPPPSVCILLGTLLAAARMAGAAWEIVGWNNLGMHCMDSDYSVFSILPPYNTVHAQVILTTNGRPYLVTNGSVLVTYEAVADPAGSINRTSIGKGNFWQYSQPLYGPALAPDVGLPLPGPEGRAMPGASNAPQPMAFESNMSWYAGYGVPITPYDDAGRPNQYPMMRLTARTSNGTLLAATDVVLPVSDEMDCKLCHLSDSGPTARPAAGWVRDLHPGRDYRLNILRLHDERQSGNPLYAPALASNGFNAAGLFATVTVNGRPILCASCHASEALPGTGRPGIPPLTQAMHAHHAGVTDPRNGLTLEAASNRVSCYTCHPGSATRCLRGAMGKAVAADGAMAMQCQSCHGGMSDVGAAGRTGWLEEPNCQACHSGDAVNNAGQIRFLSAITNGALRTNVFARFATNPHTPGTNLSLYRYSRGHGGLQCSACHGSTHAEYPSAFTNDNLQELAFQGHEGTIAECDRCHGSQPANSTAGLGPHGLHPVGDTWAQSHADAARALGLATCRACHGANDRGTVLSRAFGTRTVSTKYGSRTFWRGYPVGCYNCHDGTGSSDPTTRGFPTVASRTASATASVPAAIALSVSNGAPRIVSQPAHGLVILYGSIATNIPDAGFSGTDRFTFAANNGYNDSSLATVTVAVAPAPDTDSDGVPDGWVQQHFGHPTGMSNDLSRAEDDPDQDRHTNREELLAGTDPRDARSCVRVFPLAWPGSLSTTTRVAVVSHLGQRFQFERTDALESGVWTPVGNPVWGRTDATEPAPPPGASPPFLRAVVVP